MLYFEANWEHRSSSKHVLRKKKGLHILDVKSNTLLNINNLMVHHLCQDPQLHSPASIFEELCVMCAWPIRVGHYKLAISLAIKSNIPTK
jgi:hypothetical protein